MTPDPFDIRLDWKAYFKAFCDKHGDPVQFNDDRLLFADGWTYSATSYQGPEYPPPESEVELLELQIKYYKLRLDRVVRERDHLTKHGTNLQHVDPHGRLTRPTAGRHYVSLASTTPH